MKRFAFVSRLFLFLLIIVSLACTPVFSWAPGADIPSRAGTITAARAASDGTVVTLDAVNVVKICGRQSPCYILVNENAWPMTPMIVYPYFPTSDMRIGMPVEITGTVTTAYGAKCLTSVTVKAYKNPDNSIYYGAITKPDAAPLVWTDGVVTMAPGASPPTTPSVTPNATIPDAATFYTDIADAKINAADGKIVWFTNKKILSVGGDEYGSYIIIAADGSNDTIKVYTAASASTLDRAGSVIGMISTHSGSRTVSADTGPEVDLWTYIGSVQLFDSGLIGWVKAQPNGVTVNLSQKVVSAIFPGYFYVCEQERVPGIKVVSARRVDVGRVVNLFGGTIATASGEKYLNNPTVGISLTAPLSIKPIGMNNRSLGGDGFLYDGEGGTQGQPGVYAGVGLNTVGLLVRIWGKVTAIGSLNRWYVIDDGTGLSWTEGSTTYTGVKIVLGDNGTYFPMVDEHGLAVEIGDYADGINGISSCVTIDGTSYRCLRQIGAFGQRGPPWWPVNKINRVSSPGM